MQWNMSTHGRISVKPSAHREHVLSMTMFRQNSLLATACREGCVKLWAPFDLKPLEEVQAHGKSINQLHTDGQFLYTAAE